MYAVRNWLIGGMIIGALAAAPVCGFGAGMPDTIKLDSLKQYYDSVTFKHARHIVLVKDCAECHHHTTGTLVEDPNCVRCHKNSTETKTVACRGCHTLQPFSAEALRARSSNPRLYHQDKPGLKGAYHQSCMGCHEQKGGPMACDECHEKTDKGNALYNTGTYAPAPGSKKHGGH